MRRGLSADSLVILRHVRTTESDKVVIRRIEASVLGHKSTKSEQKRPKAVLPVGPLEYPIL
jgi:hypothetical protein